MSTLVVSSASLFAGRPIPVRPHYLRLLLRYQPSLYPYRSIRRIHLLPPLLKRALLWDVDNIALLQTVHHSGAENIV